MSEKKKPPATAITRATPQKWCFFRGPCSWRSLEIGVRVWMGNGIPGFSTADPDEKSARLVSHGRGAGAAGTGTTPAYGCPRRDAAGADSRNMQHEHEFLAVFLFAGLRIVPVVASVAVAE